MITQFEIRNFKNLSNVSFSPRPLSLVIGPNGCGKSSLLQSIDFLRAFFRSSVEVYLQEKEWEYRDLPNLRQGRKAISWAVTAELGPDDQGFGDGRYEYFVTLSPRRYLGIGLESLKYRRLGASTDELLINRKGRTVLLHDRRTGRNEEVTSYRLPASIITTLDPEHARSRFPELFHFRRWVEGLRYFQCWDPKVLRNPDRGRHEELGPSGEHIAPLLALLRQRNQNRFDGLMKRMRRLFPHVTDLSVTGGRGWGWKSLRLHEGDASFNSQQMSDGFLRLLAVTSLLYLDSPPPVILLEEPENGIHPQLLREVVGVLRELTQRKHPRRSQVIFTTHNPYVLDEFYDTPEDVFVMERHVPQAGASIKPLNRASQLDVVRAAFGPDQSLGEAWFSGLLGGTAGLRAP